MQCTFETNRMALNQLHIQEKNIYNVESSTGTQHNIVYITNLADYYLATCNRVHYVHVYHNIFGHLQQGDRIERELLEVVYTAYEFCTHYRKNYGDPSRYGKATLAKRPKLILISTFLIFLLIGITSISPSCVFGLPKFSNSVIRLRDI